MRSNISGWQWSTIRYKGTLRGSDQKRRRKADQSLPRLQLYDHGFREQSLYDVWLLVKDKRLKQIPISNQASEPLGLLYANEAREVLMKEVEYEDLLLRDYVMGIGYR